MRRSIYQEVSAAHSERHHISELNIDFIKKFEICHGPPAADRALLENEHLDGMCAAYRRVARRLKFAPKVDRRRHFLGKAAESTEYCDLCLSHPILKINLIPHI
jgi:hypothetical protein